jgi:vacuolar-type H+-ATPase catalytic subunit A/Vma1
MLDGEEVLLAAATFIVSANRKTKRLRRFWVRPTVQSRRKYKASDLLEDLMLDDNDPLKHEYRSSFTNFLRLTNECEILVNNLGPKVSKEDTNCRHDIPVNECFQSNFVQKITR